MQFGGKNCYALSEGMPSTGCTMMHKTVFLICRNVVKNGRLVQPGLPYEVEDCNHVIRLQPSYFLTKLRLSPILLGRERELQVLLQL